MRAQRGPLLPAADEGGPGHLPDPETGKVQKLFTKRECRPPSSTSTATSCDFYDALTRYVEDQSIEAASDDSARGRAVGFTMAMLQRRFASSVYAVRRSLERMREQAREDPGRPRSLPAGADREASPRRLRRPDRGRAAGDHRPARRRGRARSIRPPCARRSCSSSRLIDQARGLEQRESRVQAGQAQERAHGAGRLRRPEHEAPRLHRAQGHARLPGRRRQGRPPLGKLREWGLTVTQIHGGMKIGDRDTPGSRIYAEREFREECPGPGRHGGRRRRHQPPVLLADDQLRHPLEPGPPGAADRPHPPLRPGAGLPDLQLRRPEHPRGPRPAEAARAAAGDPQTSWAPTRCSTSWARSSRPTCWRSCSGTCTPTHRR